MIFPVAVVLFLLLTLALAGCSNAAIDHKEAIALGPQLALAYNNRGLAYGGISEYQKAIENYDEAIRLDHQLAGAYALRALDYTNLDRDLEAQQDTERAIELGFTRFLLESAIQEARSQR